MRVAAKQAIAACAGMCSDWIPIGVAPHCCLPAAQIVTQPQRNAPVSQMHSRNDPAADVPVAKPQVLSLTPF